MKKEEIENYIRKITYAELQFRNPTIKKNKSTVIDKFTVLIYSVVFVVISIFDFVLLFLKLKFNKSFLDKRIVYTGVGSLNQNGDHFEDRHTKQLDLDNLLYISTNKEKRIKKIEKNKVYNIGGFVKLVYLFQRKRESKLMRMFFSYSFVNNQILKLLKGNEVYVICLWELNTLSVVFSEYRDNFKLIKIQHGNMINYPPYVEVAPVKIADLFYVKNQQTADFLKKNLCKNYSCEYKLIPRVEKNLTYYPGIHIFYASTIETEGFHPVFLDFLNNNTNDNLNIIIRLHPRERDKMKYFIDIISKYKVNYKFDNSPNWLIANRIKNLIVVSPWSSMLEEAYDNGFLAITIDKVGLKRYEYLVDNKQFFFSENLSEIIDTINPFVQ